MVLLNVLADRDTMLYCKFFAYGCHLDKIPPDFFWLTLLKLDENVLNIVVTLILSPCHDFCLTRDVGWEKGGKLENSIMLWIVHHNKWE